jgi:hypothetical protein
MMVLLKLAKTCAKPADEVKTFFPLRFPFFMSFS